MPSQLSTSHLPASFQCHCQYGAAVAPSPSQLPSHSPPKEASLLISSAQLAISRRQVAKEMDEVLEPLPSLDEVQKIFKEFRQVLKAGALLTPLQRVNKIVTRNSSIAYGQKRESDANRVYNLLPPGHFTRVKVDFMQLLSASELSVTLKIPVTLLKNSDHSVLLKNNDLGLVVSRSFDDESRALQAFLEEVSKTAAPRATNPRFVHKRASLAANFYSDANPAVEAWREAKSGSQLLQQFVQPHSKKPLLLRAHWKDNQKSPTFYYISPRSPQAQTLPSILTKVCDFSRSFSDTDLEKTQSGIWSSASTLIVQRSKEIPELTKALEACLKVISSSLVPGEKVSEMVCDFTSDQQHQWVFLSCRGFSFACKKRMLTQKLEPKRTIDLKYLMYPVIARRSILQKRLRWNAKLRDIAANQKLTVAALMKTLHDYTELPVEPLSSCESPQMAKAATSTKKPKSAKPSMETLVLNREVSRYDQLMMKSKVHKECVRGSVNFIDKHGGCETWKPMLLTLLLRFQSLEGASALFADKMGFEERDSFVHALLRVIRGDCNMYYKEALRKVHHRVEVPKDLYSVFLQEMEQLLLTITRNTEDAKAILHRFGQLEPYICK